MNRGLVVMLLTPCMSIYMRFLILMCPNVSEPLLVKGTPVDLYLALGTEQNTDDSHLCSKMFLCVQLQILRTIDRHYLFSYKWSLYFQQIAKQ